MKTSVVGGRVPTDIAKRSEIIGLNVSEEIRNFLFKKVSSIDQIERSIIKKKEELEEMERYLMELKKERELLEPKLKIFFKETKRLLKTRKDVIKPRIQALYNLFNIPTDEYEFRKMMEEYTNDL